MNTSHWIKSRKFDLLFIIAPAYLALGLALLLKDYNSFLISFLIWAIVNVIIDSSHVFVTAFRTFLSPKAQKLITVYIFLIPIGSLLVCYSILTYDFQIYMKFLVYMVAFHYIRQHFGIFMRYFSSSTYTSFGKYLNIVMIYSSLIIPMIYWHTMPKSHGWYDRFGFYFLPSPDIFTFSQSLYFIIIIIYISYELFHFIKYRTLNIPKNLFLFGVSFTWYFSIVIVDNFLVFALVNNISHSLPYFAFTWIYSRKELNLNSFFRGNLLQFLLWPIIFALITQFSSDLIFDHKYLNQILNFEEVVISNQIKIALASVLGACAISHYLFDAIIWKKKYLNSNIN